MLHVLGFLCSSGPYKQLEIRHNMVSEFGLHVQALSLN